MTTPEIVIIITTVTTGVVSIVNAISSGWGRKEVRKKAAEVKQVGKDVHEDIVNKVTDTVVAVSKAANGDMAHLTNKIDSLTDRMSRMEAWIAVDRTARTRSTDQTSSKL